MMSILKGVRSQSLSDCRFPDRESQHDSRRTNMPQACALYYASLTTYHRTNSVHSVTRHHACSTRPSARGEELREIIQLKREASACTLGEINVALTASLRECAEESMEAR
jgi:hypothetical protein